MKISEVTKIGVTYSYSFNLADISFEAIMDIKSVILNLVHDNSLLLKQANNLFARLDMLQDADPGDYKFVCHKKDNGETAYEWVKE